MASQRIPLRPSIWSSSSYPTKLSRWRCLPKRESSIYTGLQEISEDILPRSSLQRSGPSDEAIQSFDPVASTKARKTQLPPSRYQFRPPKYYRGPLHPHQPPPTSDPSSRQFIPGPFSLPRLAQTYDSTIAPDLQTLYYKHYPPGQLPGPSGPRLRSWDGSSPYHKNRPLRKPRGGPVLPLMERNITFRNIPTLHKIVVHTAPSAAAAGDSAFLHIAGMVLQAITNVRGEVITARKSVAQYNQRMGRPMGVKCELYGEDMWEFLSKVVETVMPRMKEYRGVSGGSGDGSGNLAWGFEGDVVGGMEEVAVNYDS
ncbi:MAG: hypothetical protein HETSPECPRED_005092 [Heterodermia speciosa]|uniref:Large ribosomal subunit protein uL5 C-terminal domain-containing protein n=1 Tax=Heterodermia speciosa TaxID=116794 RepID=A0A8H3FDF3_9LECA|nr:MAG: hypothetical protein HETSPECPRED_005092 [Heterodermia speciosa]